MKRIYKRVLIVLVVFLFTTLTGSRQKQISEIHIRSHSGNLRIYFEENRMHGFKYGVNDGFVEKSFDDGEMDEYKEYMSAFCRRVFSESDKYHHNSSEAVMVFWELEVTYDDVSKRKMAAVEGAQKRYPDDWDDFTDMTNKMLDYKLFNELIRIQ